MFEYNFDKNRLSADCSILEEEAVIFLWKSLVQSIKNLQEKGIYKKWNLAAAIQSFRPQS